MLKRHEVLVLLRAGQKREEIRRLAGGVRAKCPSDRARVAGVVEVDDAGARAASKIGRPSKVEGFRNLVTEIVGGEPDLVSVEILRRIVSRRQRCAGRRRRARRRGRAPGRGACL